MLDQAQLERHYTLEEYLQLPEGRPYYELEDGRLIAMPPAHSSHGLWMGRIFGYLDRWVREHGGFASQEVGTYPGGNWAYIPDLIYVSPDHMDRHVKGGVQGMPDLAVEIFNSGGARRDRVRKFNVYRERGLEWYWLVDCEEQVFEEYHLEDGAYVRTREAGPGDDFKPRALAGLVIPVDEIARL